MMPSSRPSAPMPPTPRRPIVHVDAQLLVADKPAGLLAVPGRTEPDCLLARLQEQWPELRVVHRLDQATSGLIVFAHTAQAQRRLSDAFASRRVHKRYEALIHGLLRDDLGEVALPLRADWPNRPRQIVDAEQGRPAVTRYRVLQRDPSRGRTRVSLEPVTGRSHQLRVHLLSIGHPIVGDRLYGPADEDDGDGQPAPRLMLHATELAFEHPDDGRPCRWSSPCPF